MDDTFDPIKHLREGQSIDFASKIGIEINSKYGMLLKNGGGGGGFTKKVREWTK